MAKATLTMVNQKLDDFIEYSKIKLNSIEKQVYKTNGRVNKHDTDLALLSLNFDKCPAKESFNIKTIQSNRANLISFCSVLVAFISLIFVIFF